MQDFEKLGVFYLGKQRDSENLLLYDSKDLVTHAVCVGMTGSGKTGLCLGLIEEAAIDNIPALLIDPKGDLSNLLLTFPNLKPADFEPWINGDDARNKGLEPAAFAAQQAELWKRGLAASGQSGERIGRLKESAEFNVYTPGGDAGIPLSIMKSFSAPAKELMEDREAVRDRVTSTATSLLGLIGVDADPVQSREHVLISTIFDTAWREGKDLDLAALIAQIQNPPFTKVGVMDTDSFFPSKDRFALAMQFNNLLASPGFEAWLQGDPLDIAQLLWTPAGKPRISILSIAHLSDAERMFFVSLLLNQTLSWVRTQSGTTSLRAILYMDEIFGYFPPVANPPSKRPLLTLLKQARAFGLGLVLATQNPVDLDYKGLSNCGTWFIGRLQTERDKARVLEGLEGASAAASGKFNKDEMGKTLAGLGNRIFLLNNVHEDHPVLFETRWTLSYLRGPLSRPQMKTLMEARKSSRPAESAPDAKAKASAAPGASAAPVLPPDVAQIFIPLRAANPAPVYEPRIFGAAQVRFTEPKFGVDILQDVAFLVPVTDATVAVDWSAAEVTDVPVSDVEKEAQPGATFADLPSSAAKGKNYAAWQKAFATWLYQTQKLDLLQSPSLGEVSKPGESERDFRVRLQQQAREKRDKLSEDLRAKYAPKIAAIEERKRKAAQRVEAEKEQATSQTLSSVVTIGSSILGAFMGRKTISATNINRAATAARSMTRIGKARGDVDRASETVEALDQQIQDLNAEFEGEVNSLTTTVDPTTESMQSVSVAPKKTNINVQLVALAWTAE
jgi:hypothetical protein